MALTAAPRVRLAVLPTPLVDAPRLAEALGVASLRVKRDDLTGFAVAGNKARQLELLVAEARKRHHLAHRRDGRLELRAGRRRCRSMGGAAVRAGAGRPAAPTDRPPQPCRGARVGGVCPLDR